MWKVALNGTRESGATGFILGVVSRERTKALLSAANDSRERREGFRESSSGSMREICNYVSRSFTQITRYAENRFMLF